MTALPQQPEPAADEPAPGAVRSVLRARPHPSLPHYYRNRPLHRPGCPSPPAIPAPASTAPHIRLVAPIPGLAHVLLEPADDLEFEDDPEFEGDAEFEDDSEFEGGAEFEDGSGFEDDAEFEDDPEFEGGAEFEDDPEFEDGAEFEDDSEFEDGAEFEDDLESEDDSEFEDEFVDEDLSDYHEEIEAAGPVAPTTVASSAPVETALATGQRERLPLLLTATIVAVLIGLGAAGYAVVRHQSVPPSTRTVAGVTPVGADPAGQATSWTLANLPSTTKLLADPSTQTVLIGQGFPSTNVSAVSSNATSNARYVIVTPAVRAAGAAAGSPVARMLAGALPVAVFGNGIDRVEISQLGAMATSLNAAQQARVMAGQALSRNPGLTGAGSLSAAIGEGRLDVRACTLLAVLANQARVRVVAMPQTTPEARAGAPVRTVRFIVAGADPATLVNQLVRALPPDMAPSQSERLSDGSFQLVWLPDLALSLPVN